MLRAGLGNGATNDQLLNSKERKRGPLKLRLGDNEPEAWKMGRGWQSRKVCVQFRGNGSHIFLTGARNGPLYMPFMVCKVLRQVS